MNLSPEAREAIHEEEQKLRTVIDSLLGQLQQSSRKLETERKRARALTSELVAATREEDKAMLASDEAVAHALSHKKAGDIKNLQKLLKRPYFARFMVEEPDQGGTRQMEYKLGFSANTDCRIIDWRTAPISKLYYEYSEGDEYSELIQGRERNGVVRLRNAMEIDGEVLQKLSCRHGQFALENNEWVQLRGSDRSRGMAAKGSYGELPNILSLITPDQFQTITEDAETAILIQGLAGSGKTTVALHRLAWLLHEQNSDLTPDSCVVVVLSRILKAYVSNTLPSMDIHGVRVLTYHEWAQETLRRVLPHLADQEGGISRPADPTPRSIIRVKRSFAVLRLLEERAAAQRLELVSQLERNLPWEELPSGLRRVIDTAQALPEIPGDIVEQLQRALNRGLEVISASHPRYNGLRQAKDILAHTVDRLSSYEEFLIDLLDQPDALLEYDETRLLDRTVIKQARDRTRRNADEQVLDQCDDGLMLRLAQQRLDGVFMRDGSSGRYQHIVVDEIQDFSPTELATFIGAVKNTKHLTLVGDTAQKIDQTSVFPGWDKLMDYWNFDESMSRYISLTVSHRSTLPIMRLAEFIQRRPAATEGRDGRVPIWFKCNTETKGIRSAINWLGKAMELYPGALTAVICPSPAEAKHALSLLQPSFGAGVRLGDEQSFSFDEGIVVTDAAQVKGLEFFSVLIWNPDKRSYPGNQHGRNLLYVAATRAEENLCLVTWKRPSPHLPGIYSKLVRGIDMTIDEL